MVAYYTYMCVYPNQLINTRIIFDIVKYINQFKISKTYALRKSQFNRFRIL